MASPQKEWLSLEGKPRPKTGSEQVVMKFQRTQLVHRAREEQLLGELKTAVSRLTEVIAEKDLHISKLKEKVNELLTP